MAPFGPAGLPAPLAELLVFVATLAVALARTIDLRLAGSKRPLAPTKRDGLQLCSLFGLGGALGAAGVAYPHALLLAALVMLALGLLRHALPMVGARLVPALGVVLGVALALAPGRFAAAVEPLFRWFDLPG